MATRCRSCAKRWTAGSSGDRHPAGQSRKGTGRWAWRAAASASAWKRQNRSGPSRPVAPLPERVAERGLFAAAQMQLAEAIPQLLEAAALGRRDDRPVDLASLAQPVGAVLLDGGQAGIAATSTAIRSSLSQRRLDGA